MPQSDHHITRVAGEIERYLAAHPTAADSLEGIAKWWLARQRYEEAFGLVQAALDLLVVRGRISKTVNTDGKQIFKVKKATEGENLRTEVQPKN